ncbi:hypothetical protein BCR33DRAFT_767878 [Rhizoclosmatium globosum]|uniref:Homeobox domain-containing protein n=1 Tax=Rhizoclosmatium globosum TaxID=329046 RepID=A0A1Y2C115_9FUNG|nr:hypothetical protein BCR33DRAFT_767878 [Rhizoclosmatium globosum]|eukprot:ORY40710.1 hypothetical protein BCR33DRAFT_767878 [Rhizoclosmatium globosum]
MDPTVSQLEFLASLKSLRLDVFSSNGSTKPVDYMHKLTALLNQYAVDLETPTFLTEQLLAFVQSIQAKCILDQECMETISQFVCNFEMVATMPGTLFEESTAERATRVPLYQWLIQHQDNPYPNEEEKVALCAASGMTVSQLNHWFVNSRRRNVANREDLNMLYGQLSFGGTPTTTA